MRTKTNLLLLLALFLGTHLHSQTPCGFDMLMEALTSEDSTYQSQLDSFDQNYADMLLNAMPPFGGGSEKTYEIPLVFHIIHDGGPENITNEQIYQAVEQANFQFAGGEGGFNTKITFHVASVDPNEACVTGINRVQMQNPGVPDISSGFRSDTIFKDMSRWPIQNYVNVWIVKYIDQGGYTAGYATLPPARPRQDGIVIRYDRLGTTGAATGNITNTLAHELGHYLGLYHVWGWEWIGPNDDRCELNCDLDNCLVSGDRVCDTDPAYTIFSGGDCTPLASHCETYCPGFPVGEYFHPKDNYMSYHHACQNKFTQGQAQRMWFTIDIYRPELPASACNNSCDIVITSNTIFDSPKTIGGDIYVQSGATLTISTYLEFGEGNGIYVEDGGKLVLTGSGSMLNKCPNADHWQGVKVEQGGELVVRHAYIYNAVDAITAYSGSTADIDTIVVIGLNNYTGSGIIIQGDVSVPSLKKIKIHNVRQGIFTLNGAGNLYHFDGGEIQNTTYGILVSGNSAVINDYSISDGQTGIVLDNSPGSILFDNHIVVSGTGIAANWSPFTYIGNNTIGWGSLRPGIGISMFQSGGSGVSDNSLRVKLLSIRLWQSDALVAENQISTTGINQFGGAIQVNDTHGAQIIENEIDVDQAAFGIETVSSSGTRIEGNLIDLYAVTAARTAAIRSMGSMDEFIGNNTIISLGNAAGIVTQNATSNQYQCNVITSTIEGISIYYNSEIQNIRGNELDASTDLVIRSQIGLQNHHGNKFIGGKARANELGFEELSFSQFYVNSVHPTRPNLMPTDIIPSSGWFVDQNNLNVYACSAVHQGPEWVAFDGGDEGILCRYYEYLLSVRDEKPEQFAVKLIHLLRYSDKKSGFSMPGCITSDSTFLSLCGITELAEVSLALEKTGKTEVVTDIATLQSQYMGDTSALNRSLLQAELNDVETEIALKRLQDSTRLDSIYNVLLSISCTDSLVLKWKAAYLVYTKFLGGDSLDIADRTVVENLSHECSDTYGDAIHLARAMANIWDETYYDSFDGCGYSTPPPFRVDGGFSGNITVAPNPSTGIFHITLPEGFEGSLTVMDITGQILEQRTLKNDNRNEIDLSAYNGVLLMRFSNSAGFSAVHKVIVIH